MPYPQRGGLSSNIPETAFGEVSVAEPAPLFQISAQYGIRDDVLTVNLGGSTSAENGNFIASTGVGTSNVSAIITAREAQYKAGQGLLARFTAIFTKGEVGSEQQAGFINSESAFAFGYQGVDFGIIHSKGGALEHRKLTILSGASGSETASVTVDGVLFSVPLTSGSASHNAYEIATYINNNSQAYNLTSNAEVVTALARLPDFGGGGFSFSSATSSASWSLISSGLLPTVAFVPKDEWNVSPGMDVDPTLGNVYQIKIQYLGYGGVRFYIENSESADFVLVHIIKYANTSTTPSVGNPIFRIGWAARNTGNDSDIMVKGASCGAFNEGVVVYDNESSGVCNEQVGTSTLRENILTLRNRLTYQGVANRAEIIPSSLVLSTDTAKTALYEVIVNPEVANGESLIFQYLDEQNELMEYSTSQTNIIGGKVVACYPVKSGSPFSVDIQSIVKYHPPNAVFCIAARVSSGAASEMIVSANWVDDL